jgi:hypothetical protein
MGRPSTFTQEVADAICERIAAGESLRLIVLDEGMPDERTVYRWLDRDEAFRQQYARAREAQADAMVEDILEICDDARNDWMERRGEEDAGWVANGEHIQRSKLRVDARKWLMSKLAPKKYGDKLDLNHGGQKDNPLELLLQAVDGKTRGLPNGG